MPNRITLHPDAPAKVGDVHVFAYRPRRPWHVGLIVHRDGLERRHIAANFARVTIDGRRYTVHVMPSALHAVAVLVTD